MAWPGVEMSMKFGPGLRLRSRAEFVAVQHSGRRVSAKYLTLLGQPNSLTCDRLGIVASRRVGGAVVRNRAKRRLRDIFRRQQPASAAEQGRVGYDFVAIARRETSDAPFAALERDMVGAMARLRSVRPA